MKYKNVIFDMDGVLIDNSEGIKYCVRKAISELGLKELSDGELTKFIGPALMYSLKEYAGATDEQSEQGYLIYRKYYLEKGIKMYRLYDGVRETLAELNAHGVRCSVSSGKPIECVNIILGDSDTAKYFEKAAGSVKAKKYSSKDAQMREAVLERPAVMVGDRVFDLEAAKNADVDCIYARYGFGDESDTAVYKPKFYIDSPREIIEIVLK